MSEEVLYRSKVVVEAGPAAWDEPAAILTLQENRLHADDMFGLEGALANLIVSRLTASAKDAHVDLTIGEPEAA